LHRALQFCTSYVAVMQSRPALAGRQIRLQQSELL
jgi:hypothetical protein